MDLESVILSEVRQRRRNSIWHPLYVESKKKLYKWTYLQNRKRLTDLENELRVTRREELEEGIGRELGVDMYTLQCLKWVTSRTCCTAQGTLLQVVWRPGWGRSLQENGYLYVCGRNYRSMVNQLYSNTKWRVKKKWIGNPQIGRKICDTRTQQRNLYPEYTRIYYNLGIISSKSLLKNAQRFPTIW